jgi:hypothetical protein
MLTALMFECAHDSAHHIKNQQLLLYFTHYAPCEKTAVMSSTPTARLKDSQLVPAMMRSTPTARLKDSQIVHAWQASPMHSGPRALY